MDYDTWLLSGLNGPHDEDESNPFDDDEEKRRREWEEDQAYQDMMNQDY